MKTLNLFFKNEEDFNQAVDFYATMNSEFTAEAINNEFQAIEFNVEDQEDADATEMGLVRELEILDLSDYHFEFNN